MVRRALLGSFFLFVLSLAGAASADRVTDAEALFRAAKDLTKANDWAAACPKFEASYELDPQLGVLMNIADCYEHEGKTATAWARWNAAEEWAKREADDRLAYIQERREKLVPRLPKMIVRVEHPVDQLAIQRGEVPVPPATYGLEVPVDPGTVVVTVRRGEQILEQKEVTAREAELVEVRFDLAAIAAAHPPAADEPAPGAYDPTQRNVGIIIAAVGGAAVLVAGGLEIGALVKKGQAEEPDACVNRFCAPDGLADVESAATLAEAGQWVGIAGLATLAVGITVLLTAPDEPSAEESEEAGEEAMVAPWMGPHGGGLVLGGSF